MPGVQIDPFEMPEVIILVSQLYYTIGNVQPAQPTTLPQLFEEALVELPLGLIMSSLLVFTAGALGVYFFVWRKEQDKLEKDTFLFTVDEKYSNRYSKKIKFLDEQEVQVSKVWATLLSEFS